MEVVGGIFRRVREARELGESHGKVVEEQMERMGELVDVTFKCCSISILQAGRTCVIIFSVTLFKSRTFQACFFSYVFAVDGWCH